MTVGVILLAAGSARRMGGDKLTIHLGGRPLGLHMLEAIEAAGMPPPLVAVAPGSPAAALFADRCRCIAVADHAMGQSHSIAAAIRAVPDDWTAALICLADMPFVQANTLKALAGAATAEAVVRPVFAGQPGNPVAWGRDHFPALAALIGDQGGRAIMAGLSVTMLACDDPGVAVDIDTPAALEAARLRLKRP